MDARPGSAGLLRRAFDANLRYYEALGELTLDYIRALRSLSDAASPAVTRYAADAVSDVVARASAAAQPRPAPTLVLEAEAGETAVGAFMVENMLQAPVSAPVSASGLGDAPGVDLQFDPPVVTLAPGEQVLVRVGAVISDALEPGVGHRAEVSVPGLTGTQVPVVVRRRETTPP